MGTIITVSLHVLGVVGMAGIWLIPARAWSLLVLRRVRHPLPYRPLGILLAIITFVPIAISLFVGPDLLTLTSDVDPGKAFRM